MYIEDVISLDNMVFKDKEWLIEIVMFMSSNIVLKMIKRHSRPAKPPVLL